MSKRDKAIKPKEFAKLLQDWREERGFSQRDAADALGLSKKSLQNWEQERSMPQGIAVRLMVKLLQGRGFEVKEKPKDKKKKKK